MTDVRQLPEAFLLKMQELLGEEFGQLCRPAENRGGGTK